MEKYWNDIIAKIIAIIICAVFTFGGAVNMGWSGFAMAVPFMAIWAFTAWSSERSVIITSLCLAVAIIPFYILRLNESSLFFPYHTISNINLFILVLVIMIILSFCII